MKFKRTRKIQDKCDIETIRTEDGILMKCKNLRRNPTAQEILDGVKTKKIIWKD